MFAFLQKSIATFTFVIEVGLIVRFILKLLGFAGFHFVTWFYVMTNPLLVPFIPFFPRPAIRVGMEIEFTTIAAIFAYAIGSFIIQELLRVLNQRFQVAR
jgi:hypothetical protein